jgi:hypothetical protein
MLSVQLFQSLASICGAYRSAFPLRLQDAKRSAISDPWHPFVVRINLRFLVSSKMLSVQLFQRLASICGAYKPAFPRSLQDAKCSAISDPCQRLVVRIDLRFLLRSKILSVQLLGSLPTTCGAYQPAFPRRLQDAKRSAIRFLANDLWCVSICVSS